MIYLGYLYYLNLNVSMTKQWMVYMVLHSLLRIGDCDHLYFILYEVDNYQHIEDIVY